MSSFWGYVLEGMTFTVIWIWWMIHTYVGVIKAQSTGKEFIPKLSYPLPGTKIPIEIIFKLFMSSVGFLAAVFEDGINWVDDAGNYRKMAIVITMTIYGIFMLHSLMELLLWYGVPLVRDSDYVTAALAFLWYSLATYYRAKDFISHASVAVMVKTFPMYPLFGIGVSLLIEAERKRGYWTQMMRVICLGILATWNWNSAFILHSSSMFPGREPSNWDMLNHDNTAFIGAAFGDHICFHLIFTSLVYAGTTVFMRMRYGIRMRHDDLD